MGSIYTTQLENLLRTSRNASDPQAKQTLSRIHSEIKARLSRGSPASSFFSEVSRGFAKMTGIAHAELRMECLYHCAQFFYYNDRGADGLPSLYHLERLAERTGSTMWRRKANLMLGIVLADSGDITAAVPRYYKSFDLAMLLEDRVAETGVLINLGTALNYGGLYREAIPCFQRAIANASQFVTVAFLKGAALTNLAQSFMFLGEFDKGFIAIEQALTASEEPTDAISASSRSVREYTYVQLALELGKLEAAKTHAALCKRYGTSSGMLRSKLLADIAIAKCEIVSGDVEAGIRALERTLEDAGTITLKEDALVALVRAYDHAQQPEKSLAYMDALMVHVRSTREKGIAALFSMPSALTCGNLLSSEDNDLRELLFQEAKLRARVAERHALSSQIEMLERFAVTADLRDEVSGEHGYRVGRLSWNLAKRLQWKPDEAAALELGARLHDIGKVGVPDRILLSSNHLADIERHFVCAHTAIGADLLGKSRIPQVRLAEEIARHHHEWWNGAGYPSRLCGDRIPIHARIVAIADVFDALTHGRPYAQPWSVDEALLEISNRRGSQFDPILTDLFLQMISEIRRESPDLNVFLSRGASVSPFAEARERIRAILTAEREIKGAVAATTTN